MPKWNKPYKTLITNAGEWGWISDKLGYKYINFIQKQKKVAKNTKSFLSNMERIFRL